MAKTIENKIPLFDRLTHCGACLIGSGVIAAGFYEILTKNRYDGPSVVFLGAAMIASAWETQREAKEIYSEK